jgi:hypothetical protein
MTMEWKSFAGAAVRTDRVPGLHHAADRAKSHRPSSAVLIREQDGSFRVRFPGGVVSDPMNMIRARAMVQVAEAAELHRRVREAGAARRPLQNFGEIT